MMEHQDGTFESKLKELAGVVKPHATNVDAIKRFKAVQKSNLSVDEMVDSIINGNRMVLSQAITLVESALPKHHDFALQIIDKCLPYSGKSLRIGITGVPGVGKSRFIESFGSFLTQQGIKLAVLAIDPSSEKSKGSILGDKTRMEKLTTDPNAYIRPSPSAGTLGGVARKTRESILLCEAAGFNVIIIETVGVGQSETAVHSMVDFFLLLMLAGAGDELQGIKRGIMEMADSLAITKADGNNIDKAEMARIEYQNALHLFPPNQSNWRPKVQTCSARFNIGMENLWQTINDYVNLVKGNSYFEQRRRDQALFWMHEDILEHLKTHFYGHGFIKNNIEQFEAKVLKGEISSFVATHDLLDHYFSHFSVSHKK